MCSTSPDHEIQKLIYRINAARPENGASSTEFGHLLLGLLLEITIKHDPNGNAQVVSVCRDGGAGITDRFILVQQGQAERAAWVRTGHNGEPQTLDHMLHMYSPT